MSAIREVFGNRQIALTRELTKKFEEFIRGSIEEALTWAEQEQVRGEFCLVIEGSREETIEESFWWENLSEKEHVEHYISEGYHSKEAIKKTAVDRGVPKRKIYDAYHIQN